ncbi:MAG: DUF5615 family PIN-like protein [Planctomycetaceae bacterium]
MKILFDQGVPAPLRTHLASHDVATAYELGWSNLKNGDLLDAAEGDGYEVLVTTDQNLKSQQNLTGRPIAIVVLLSTAWPKIQDNIDEVQIAIDRASPGDYTEVSIRSRAALD